MTAVSSQPRGSRFPTLEKYDVLEELGHGGMATVYRARDLRLDRDVAVKVIHPHLRDSAEVVRRFAIEARAVAKLRHANIVEVYDVSSPTDTEQYLVVELLRGVTLRKLLEQHGALPAEVAVAIGVELLAAVAHAHEAGVVHRDIKPENVIIEHRPAPTSSKDGPGSDTAGARIELKLMDFGIAKLLDAQGVTSTGQVLGSPAHMAPEQIEGRDIDGRTDVYGLGILLYECMVGHLPFQGTNPAQVLRRVLEGEYPSAERELPSVGRTWSAMLDQALAPDVAVRFASAQEMRDVLTRELTRVGVGSPRGTIEAWLDDPAGFGEAHAKTMTARLCALGEDASRKGNILAAAADYNRALAYAPHDAGLLKIVASLNRNRARRDGLRRVLPYAVGAIFIVGFSIGLVPQVARRVRRATNDAVMALPPVSRVTPPPIASDILPAPVVPDVAPSARTLARPVVGLHPPPKPVPREVRFGSVEPQQGLLVAIDGAPATPLDPNKPLAVDDKLHTLVFSCRDDLCDPLTRIVEAGDRGVSLSFRLTIKPAKLVIRGNPNNHYFLNGDTTHPLNANELMPNTVPMLQSAVRVVTVSEFETRVSQTAELHAGKTAKVVDFTAP